MAGERCYRGGEKGRKSGKEVKSEMREGREGERGIGREVIQREERGEWEVRGILERGWGKWEIRNIMILNNDSRANK